MRTYIKCHLYNINLSSQQKTLSVDPAYASIFLLLQMQFLCKDSAPLPKRPKELAALFIPLLDKLAASSMRKTILIVVDNVDLIMVNLMVL